MRWIVDARTVVLLALFAVVSILLAVGSGLAWHKAARAHANYVTLGVTAGYVLDSLNAIQCIPMNPGDAVRVFPAPDTLKRAGRAR